MSEDKCCHTPGLLPYSEALEIILQTAPSRLPSEEVDLEASLGRTADREYVSGVNVPPFDNSAMDGFAIHSELTESASPENPLRFSLEGTVVAGDPLPLAFGGTGVWEIMTGAPFPPGYDATVKIEDVEVLRNSSNTPEGILIRSPVRKNENRREAGEDFRMGDPVISKGKVITPETILALASLGIARVQVQKKPKVAILATGKELVRIGGLEAGASLEPGKIWNSTAPYLKTAIISCGAEPRFYGIVQDDPRVFFQRMEAVLADQPDLILTTGAVSVGKHDFIAKAMTDLGAEILFSKVAIRPGKPILFGSLPTKSARRVHFFGLPGNPVSTAVGFRFFVLPFLRNLAGNIAEPPRTARLLEDCKKPEGLRCFFKASIKSVNGESCVEILPGQSSFMVSPLLRANAWAILPESGSVLEKGTLVETVSLL